MCKLKSELKIYIQFTNKRLKNAELVNKCIKFSINK